MPSLMFYGAYVSYNTWYDNDTIGDMIPDENNMKNVFWHDSYVPDRS